MTRGQAEATWLVYWTELARQPIVDGEGAIVLFGNDEGDLLVALVRPPTMVPLGDWYQVAFSMAPPIETDDGPARESSPDYAPLRDYRIVTTEGSLVVRAGFAPWAKQWAVVQQKENG